MNASEFKKVDIRNGSKKLLLSFIKDSKPLRVKYIESEYFEDFYPLIFETFIFTDEQLLVLKNDYIKRRL